MDIKDYVLLVGGTIIALIAIFGVLSSWRLRRDPLRLNIEPNLFEDEEEGEFEQDLNGELPNGGSRLMGERDRKMPNEQPAVQMLLDQIPVGLDLSKEGIIPEEADIDDEVTQGSQQSINSSSQINEQELGREIHKDDSKKEFHKIDKERAVAIEAPPAEELLILYVTATDQDFLGIEVFEALKGHHLTFGDMNIFHKYEKEDGLVSYSIANISEPGNFELTDIDTVTLSGLCFFLQLPGPVDPMSALEDMFETSKSLSIALRGDLKDEQRNLLTQQMKEHYRQRILDYSRRRMSKRA